MLLRRRFSRCAPARSMSIWAVGRYPPGSPQAIEVRAIMPKNGGTDEDPVTGSLNAGLADWLLRTGRVTTPYVASQARCSAGSDESTSRVTRLARSGSAARRSAASTAALSSSSHS